jgi:hypothetical protein
MPLPDASLRTPVVAGVADAPCIPNMVRGMTSAFAARYPAATRLDVAFMTSSDAEPLLLRSILNGLSGASAEGLVKFP